MNIFLDTNVLLDFICKREPFADNAVRIFRKSAIGEFKIVVSALTIVNAKYTAKKYGYSNEETDFVIRNLLKFIDISSIDQSIIKQAFISEAKDKEDAIQYLSAQSYGADYIITRDPKGFKDSPIAVISPDDFLGM